MTGNSQSLNGDKSSEVRGSMIKSEEIYRSCEAYASQMVDVLKQQDWSQVAELAVELKRIWNEGRQVFICGNGGSAGNANHWANDFIFPIAKKSFKGMRFNSLAANTSVLTCLGNDISYGEIFSVQLQALACKGDLLILLSGSGNSENIIKVIEKAREMEIKTAGLMGFSGGKALSMVDIKIHFKVNDLQVSEDMQMVVCHMLMKTLAEDV